MFLCTRNIIDPLLIVYNDEDDINDIVFNLQDNNIDIIQIEYSRGWDEGEGNWIIW